MQQKRPGHKSHVCFYCGRSQDVESPLVTDTEAFEALTADYKLQYN